jgi:hypothetical protein
VDRPNVEEVFEAWAHVAARLRKRSVAEQATILADLGIGAEWTAVHESWSRRLNDDIGAGRMERPERYASICREEQERRRRTSALPPRPTTPPAVASRALTPLAPPPVAPEPAAPPVPPRAFVPPLKGATPLPETLDVVGPSTPAVAAIDRTTMPFAQVPENELRLAPKSTHGGDFRKDLAQPTVPPLPGQDDTASEINLQETVAAARQVSAVVDWPLERWARLCVALESESEEHAWRDQGVTSFRAREHAQRHWQKRIAGDAKLKADFQAIMARLRER